MFRLTPVVKNLIIINCIVYLAQLIIPNMTEILALWNFKSPYFKPYQLFTYMFAHGGFFHIFFNMLILATTGPILESFWGQKRFLTFYVVTGIGAGVFNYLISYFLFPGSIYDHMIGASGAVFGVLMGFGMMFPNMEMRLMIPPVSIKAKYLVWVMGGLTLLMSPKGVAHLAHLGGIVVAFIMIMIWKKRGGMFQ